MRVFLSSTYADLIPHRLQAAQAVERLGQETGRMEVFGARPQEPTEACFREIDRGVTYSWECMPIGMDMFQRVLKYRSLRWSISVL
jgi:Domain of unknown function (DUF4062)